MSWNYTFRSTFLVSKYVISFRSIFPFGLYFPSVSMWRFQMNRNYFLGNWLLQCLYDYYHSVCTIIHSLYSPTSARINIFTTGESLEDRKSKLFIYDFQKRKIFVHTHTRRSSTVIMKSSKYSNQFSSNFGMRKFEVNKQLLVGSNSNH